MVSKKTCTICNIPKLKKEFPGRNAFCKTCKSERETAKINNNVERYLRLSLTHSKVRAKIQKVSNNLEINHLVSLFDEQNGKCFYTDEELRTKRGEGQSDKSLSVDKIIPETGYVKGNVVLCTRRANLIKNNLTLEELKKWIPSWYKRIQQRRVNVQ